MSVYKQFAYAMLITWAMLFALSKSGAFQNEVAAYQLITGVK